MAEERPDVVLCDVRIGKESGLDLCRQITAQYPETKVVLLTVYDDEHYLYQALRVGASGYILKRIDGQELVGHLRRVREGETVIDHALAGRVALSAARLSAGEFWPGAHLGLTQRESEVLELLVSGHSNKGGRQQAGRQRGHGEDAHPRALPQARRLRPQRRHRRRVARGAVPLSTGAGTAPDAEELARLLDADGVLLFASDGQDLTVADIWPAHPLPPR